MSKFRLGDDVYDFRFGVGSVVSENFSPSYPIGAEFGMTNRSYLANGLEYTFHKNPSLLTLPEAREKGYDVPKEPITVTGKVKWVVTAGLHPESNGTEEFFPPFDFSKIKKGMKGTLTFVERGDE